MGLGMRGQLDTTDTASGDALRITLFGDSVVNGALCYDPGADGVATQRFFRVPTTPIRMDE